MQAARDCVVRRGAGHRKPLLPAVHTLPSIGRLCGTQQVWNGCQMSSCCMHAAPCMATRAAAPSWVHHTMTDGHRPCLAGPVCKHAASRAHARPSLHHTPHLTPQKLLDQARAAQRSQAQAPPGCQAAATRGGCGCGRRRPRRQPTAAAPCPSDAHARLGPRGSG